jgi:hypothetical protein
MAFTPHTQEELKQLNIQADSTYLIQYANKDYFNGEETIEIGKATATITDGNIYFVVVDPYGMDKLVMQARLIGRERS